MILQLFTVMRSMISMSDFGQMPHYRYYSVQGEKSLGLRSSPTSKVFVSIWSVWFFML